MDVKLISVSSKGVCKSFSLNGPMMTLGRQPECDLQVPLAKISRQHCQLQVNEDKLFVRDMKSANGTYVNGERITHQELKPGDFIALADAVKFLVQIDGQPSQIDENALRPDSPVGKPKLEKAAVAQPAKVKTAAKSAPAPTPEPEMDMDDGADNILGESFFMDMDEDDDG
jgi:pSer/pThr/pTyr-binding forkhead associated (FHA) protein